MNATLKGDAGRDAGQEERDPGAAGGDQVAEDAGGDVRRPGRGAEENGRDGAELREDEVGADEAVRAPGRVVLTRIVQVQRFLDGEVGDHRAHGQDGGRDHEPAAPGLLHELGADQAAAGQPG